MCRRMCPWSGLTTSNLPVSPAPSLTTIRIPREQLGKLAFEVLDKMLCSSRRIGREHVLDTELVVRQSTALRSIRAGEKTQ